MDSSVFLILPLDNHFQLYLRKVYKSGEKSKGGKIVTNVSGSDLLLEMQYLLISKADSRVLYITTIPDRKQKYYSTHSANYKDSTWIHVDDFSRFHFGQFGKQNEFDFYSHSQRIRNTWEIRRDSAHEKLAIHRIVKRERHRARERYEFFDEILVDEALEDPVEFIRIPRFQFVLRVNRRGSGYAIIKVNEVYALYSKEGDNRLFFDFKNESRDADISFSRISFSKRRIHFFPIESIKP